MSQFFNDLKADLTDRRLMPLVALVVIAVVAAVGWALLAGGSSSSSTTVHAVVLPAGPEPGLVTTTVTPEKAVAETASGYAGQRHGASRNPFAPLPGSATSATKASSSSSTASAASTTSSGSSSSSSSTTSSGSTTPAKPVTPKKSKTVYRVAALFGVLPAGTTPANAQLTAYENLKPSTPLPDAKNPMLVYRGVTQGKKASATFTVVGEVILHGEANCLPEPQDCAAINLAPGKSEQMEYTPPGGQTVVYELRVVSIASAKATASAAAVQLAAGPKGQALLASRGLTAVPDLVYARPDMLVFPPRRAKTARAHAALQLRRGR